MSTWIKLHADVFENPKVVRAANALTRGDVDLMVGKLARLWTWCADHAESGDLSHLTARAIARAADWRGRPDRFVDELTAAGLLDAGPRVHDWQEYAGRLIDQRKRDAARKKAEYEAKKRAEAEKRAASPLESPRESPPESPRDLRMQKRREEKREEETVRGTLLSSLRSESARPAARPSSSIEHDAPVKDAMTGTLIDRSGRVWPSLDDWAAWVREQKAAGP